MTAHRPIRPAVQSHPEQRWHEGRIASPLLADIAVNRPRRVRALAPLSVVFNGGPETILQWDRNDERVDALRLLADEAFLSLEARTDTRTAYALVPHLDDVIDGALANALAADRGGG